MTYRNMSNREGNQQRIMQMDKADMPPIVIAAYMTAWNIPMTSQDVQGIINTYGPMGERAVKKSDVEIAIKNHQTIGQLSSQSPISEEEDDTELSVHDDDEPNAR